MTPVITIKDFNEDKIITRKDINMDKIITHEDFNLNLDTLLQEGTTDTTIRVDEEMERFFDDIYRENFQEYFQQLLSNNEAQSLSVPCHFL